MCGVVDWELVAIPPFHYSICGDVALSRGVSYVVGLIILLMHFKALISHLLSC